MSRKIVSAETYARPGWSSQTKYGAMIVWDDGMTTCCAHSHKTVALAERCLAKWLKEIEDAEVEDAAEENATQSGSEWINVSQSPTPPFVLSADYVDFVGTTLEGTQILVTMFKSGRVTVATRRDKWETWSPPTTCRTSDDAK